MNHFLKAGRIFYGIAIAGLAIQQFIYSDFRPVFLPPWPAWLHSSPAWAYVFGIALLIAGVLIIINKNVRTVSVILGSVLLFLSIFLQAVYLCFIGPNSPIHLGLWVDMLKELALSGGAFVIAGSFSQNQRNNDKQSFIPLLEKLIPAGRFFFSIMLIAFGLTHFYYTDFAAGLVPSWIPWPHFWTYLAGIALMGTGISIVLNLLIRPVAFAGAVMIFIWFIILHIPRAIADPHTAQGNEITSVFEALGFSGILLTIAVARGKSR